MVRPMTAHCSKIAHCSFRRGVYFLLAHVCALSWFFFDGVTVFADMVLAYYFPRVLLVSIVSMEDGIEINRATKSELSDNVPWYKSIYECLLLWCFLSVYLDRQGQWVSHADGVGYLDEDF